MQRPLSVIILPSVASFSSGKKNAAGCVRSWRGASLAECVLKLALGVGAASKTEPVLLLKLQQRLGWRQDPFFAALKNIFLDQCSMNLLQLDDRCLSAKNAPRCKICSLTDFNFVATFRIIFTIGYHRAEQRRAKREVPSPLHCGARGRRFPGSL